MTKIKNKESIYFIIYSFGQWLLLIKHSRDHINKFSEHQHFIYKPRHDSFTS